MAQDEKQLKIFHGPINICGIGSNLSNWQKHKGAISDFITFSENKLASNSAYCLHLEKYPRILRPFIKLAFFSLCLTKYDIFHFYYGTSFLPYQLDFPVLKLFRKKIIMTYCGSEARLIEVERERNLYWDLLTISLDDPKFDNKKKWTMRWHKLWVDRAIAPRNLYASVSQIYPASKIEKDLWVHNLINLGDYNPTYSSNPIPLLVHAPSEGGIKGSLYVERAITKLEDEGYEFNYQRIENMAHDLAIELYKQADIILDQFLLGGFGTLAAEGMAMGKPVVGYIIDEVRQEHFPDCPVVNATIDTLEVVLADLIVNPDKRIEIGRKGRVFVEQHLDNESVNKKLWDVYHSL